MAGCIAFGFQKSYELQLHAKELEELKQIFIMLKNEMQYARTSLDEMFLHASRKADGVYRLWLHRLSEDLRERRKGTFQEIWMQSLHALENDLHLTEQEAEELRQIGNHISDTDSLAMYLGQLDLSIKQARKEASDKKKMYQSMGILGGIFLVIILL